MLELRHEHPRISGQGDPGAFGVPCREGAVGLHAEEAVRAAEALPGPVWVVKAQIHAGGRGKGHFMEPEAGEKGGVRLAKSHGRGQRASPSEMLGRTLVTRQTGPRGQARQAALCRGGLADQRANSIFRADRPSLSRLAFISRPRAA